MSENVVCTDYARVLAELVDTALADDWDEPRPAMALLWQTEEDPDDLRLAVKRLEGSVEEELAPLDDGGSYLAVAHSAVTYEAPVELLPSTDGSPVRITVAVDYQSHSGVVRHRNASTQWFGSAVDLPVLRQIRSLLWLDPAA
jgi:hypothetical protein